MHPVLFRIHGFDIPTYGPLIATGVLLSAYVAVRRAQKIGVSPDLILDLVFWGVIIGFVGSRILFIAMNLRDFLLDPLPLIFSRQGYVFFGGLVSALAFAIWFVRRMKAEPWQISDILAPSIPLAHTFGRVGCFFAGCCYGRICPAGWESWGVQFPRIIQPGVANPGPEDLVFSFAYWDHYSEPLSRGILPEATHSLPVFPIQLYESSANFLIFLGLLWLWRRRRFRGQIFAAYLMAYGTVRFLLEFLRGEYDDPALFELLQRGQVSQLICLAAIAAGVVIWVRRHATPLEAAPAAKPPPSEPEKPSPKDPGKHKRRRKR